MEHLAILVVGILLLVIGSINMTGNISTVHSYNRKKVKEEDIPKYGRAVGLGTVIIGAGLIAHFVLDLLQKSNIAPFVLLSSVVVGIVCIIYAQFKYNHGIF